MKLAGDEGKVDNIGASTTVRQIMPAGLMPLLYSSLIGGQSNDPDGFSGSLLLPRVIICLMNWLQRGE